MAPLDNTPRVRRFRAISLVWAMLNVPVFLAIWLAPFGGSWWWLTLFAVTAVGLLIFQYRWMSGEKRLQEQS